MVGNTHSTSVILFFLMSSAACFKEDIFLAYIFMNVNYFIVGMTNSEPILLLLAGQREVVVFRRV